MKGCGLNTSEPRRLLVEGLVIVASILLAFAIDAGWASFAEGRTLQQLTTSLHRDVTASQVAMSWRRAWAEDVVEKSRSILNGVANGTRGPALDSVVFDIGDVFVKGEWGPINNTYEQALSSGDLSLIRDAEIRFLLGRYAEALEDLRTRQERAVTQYYGQLEPFLVAHTDYSQVALDGSADGLVRGPFSTDSELLASSRDFFNLVNLKLELELETIQAMDEALHLADEVIESLQGS